MSPSRLPAIAALLFVAAAASIAAPPEQAWQDKVHPLVLGQAEDGPVEFLVVLADRADLRAARDIPTKEGKGAFVVERLRRVAAASQAPLLESLEARGAETKSLWIANTIWVRGDLAAIEEMARRTDVQRIDANPKSKPPMPEVEESTRGPGMIEWNVSQVGADQIWALGYDGSGIVVGSQDSGFFWDHPALMPSYRGWDGVTADHDYNWHDTVISDALAPPTCLSNSPYPCDDGFIFPHGTYTMGVAVGDDGGTRQIGVAPGAKWMGCRGFDLGGGTPASYMECFQWLVAPTDLTGLNPDPSMAPHVINNSWACIPAEGCNFDTLQTTVENTRAAGIVVVAAAGNDGNQCGTVQYPPAIYDASFTIGANDVNDVIGAISSRGPVTIDGSNRMKPDLVAPGINVTSAVGIWDIIGGGITWDYIAADGTSASAPHVVGAVALLLDARPDLIGNVDAIENLLKATALPFGSNQPCGGLGPADTPNHVYGHGRLDLVGLFTGDADMDGIANVYDCAIDDSTTWTLANTIDDLQLAGGNDTSLTWTQPPDVGSTTFAYDVLRSTTSDLSGSVCVESGTNSTATADSSMPGQLYYYVVQTVNPCGPNPGSASSGAIRNTVPCP